MDPTGPAGSGQGVAHVNAQIQRGQMGHAVPTDILLQGQTVTAQQVYFKTLVPMLHGNSLPAVKSQESFQTGQVLQALCFLLHDLSQFTEVIHRVSGATERAGQKQCVQLGLGGGNRDDL